MHARRCFRRTLASASEHHCADGAASPSSARTQLFPVVCPRVGRPVSGIVRDFPAMLLDTYRRKPTIRLFDGHANKTLTKYGKHCHR
jgi:hypothetical protein